MDRDLSDSKISRRFHYKVITISIDGFHSGVHKNLYAQLKRGQNKLVHEIRIETLQRASTAMDDSNLRAGARRDVGEFE
jgi:hypothetical protein